MNQEDFNFDTFWDSKDNSFRANILHETGLSREWVNKKWVDLSPIVQIKIYNHYKK